KMWNQKERKMELEKRKEYHQKILEILNQSDEFEYRLGRDTVEYLNEFLDVDELTEIGKIIPEYAIYNLEMSIAMVEAEVYPKEMIEMVPGILRKVLKTLKRINEEQLRK